MGAAPAGDGGRGRRWQGEARLGKMSCPSTCDHKQGKEKALLRAGGGAGGRWGSCKQQGTGAMEGAMVLSSAYLHAGMF